jgi:hypothetical protein
MWLSGFALTPLMFVAVCSSLLGLIFVFIAWSDATSVQATNARGSLPTALYTFTASVLLDMIGVVCGFTISHDVPDRPGLWLKGYVLPLLLVAAFVLLILSMALVRRDSWLGKKDLQVGSKALFVIAMLGFIWLFVG